METICKSCGASLKPGANFCVKCGTKVELERKCIRCGTLLAPDDVFCMECGTKNGGPAPVKKTAPAQKALTNAPQNSIGTIKGYAALIGDTLFFVHKSRLYSVSASRKGKAKLVLDARSFAKQLQSADDYGIQVFGRLHVWNEKLYFFVEHYLDEADGPKFGKYGPNHIFSYCPKTKKLESVAAMMGYAEGEFISEGKAYFCRNVEGKDVGFGKAVMEKYGARCREEDTGWNSHETNEAYEKQGLYLWNSGASVRVFVTLDLETGRETTALMPIVAPKDWPNSGETSGRIETQWYPPILHNGYVYTSASGAVMRSLRFPPDNPQAFELLPYNTIVLRDRDDGKLFAATGHVLVLSLYEYGLVALSQSDLRPIGGFASLPFRWVATDWQLYDGFLAVCSEYFASKGTAPTLYDVANARAIQQGGHIERYASMLDAIVDGNMVYAFGNLDIYNAKTDELEYSDLVLYRVPANAMFKPGTVLESYAEKLF